MSKTPYRVPHLPFAIRPRGRITFLEVSFPFNGILELAPCGARSHLPPAPLSGFLNLSAVSQHTRVPQLYFKPQPFLGFSSSECSPRRDRRPLSRPACSLALLPRSHETRLAWPCHPEFPGTPALLTRSPLSPRDYRFAFRGNVPLPARPRPCASEPLAPPTSGASKPSSLCESVHDSLGHPRSCRP